MWETAAERADLQALLDRSFAESSEHLRSIMTEPRRLSAGRLLAELPSPAVTWLVAFAMTADEEAAIERQRREREARRAAR